MTAKVTLIILIFCLGLFFAEKSGETFPSTSPSARMAARLKYHPPNNWIRHYLGDDRYKIAGRVWKVVSTQLDTYFHRPTCPNMLRQPAGIVIGFASAEEAVEAGYGSCSVCQPSASSFVYVGDGFTTTTTRTTTTVNRTRAPMRITLADGRSTAMLPPNWRRTQSGSQTIVGYAALGDVLQPLSGRGSLRFAFVNAPENFNVAPLLRARTLSQLVNNLAQSGRVQNQVIQMVQNSNITDSTLGGLSGVSLSPRGGGGRMMVAARGSKVYVLENNAAGVAGANSIVTSFQPR